MNLPSRFLFFYKTLRKPRLKNHARANDKWEREYPSPTPNHLGWTLGRKVRFRNQAGSREHVKAAFSLSENFPLFPSQLYHGKEMKFPDKFSKEVMDIATIQASYLMTVKSVILNDETHIRVHRRFVAND